MAITNGTVTDANDVRNIFSLSGDALIGQTGRLHIPIEIASADGERNVYLYLWGKKAGAVANKTNHGVGQHGHGQTSPEIVTSGTRVAYNTGNFGEHYHTIPNTGVNIVAHSAVPEGVEIWIDGVNVTATIGDQNTKGASMFAADKWGVDGTTEWDTGKLDITAAHTWTAGTHLVEIRETGDTGGTLIYLARVQPW